MLRYFLAGFGIGAAGSTAAILFVERRKKKESEIVETASEDAIDACNNYIPVDTTPYGTTLASGRYPFDEEEDEYEYEEEEEKEPVDVNYDIWNENTREYNAQVPYEMFGNPTVPRWTKDPDKKWNFYWTPDGKYIPTDLEREDVDPNWEKRQTGILYELIPDKYGDWSTYMALSTEMWDGVKTHMVWYVEPDALFEYMQDPTPELTYTEEELEHLDAAETLYWRQRYSPKVMYKDDPEALEAAKHEGYIDEKGFFHESLSEEDKLYPEEDEPEEDEPKPVNYNSISHKGSESAPEHKNWNAFDDERCDPYGTFTDSDGIEYGFDEKVGEWVPLVKEDDEWDVETVKPNTAAPYPYEIDVVDYQEENGYEKKVWVFYEGKCVDETDYVDDKPMRVIYNYAPFIGGSAYTKVSTSADQEIWIRNEEKKMDFDVVYLSGPLPDDAKYM